MLKIKNEIKDVNISRKVSFTETLFENPNNISAENGISFSLGTVVNIAITLNITIDGLLCETEFVNLIY